MEVETQAAAPDASVDPTQAVAVPDSRLGEGGDADFTAALSAFKTAMGATDSPAEAPKEPAGTTEPATPTAAPDASQAPEKPSSDLTAILARMQRFEDERGAAQSEIQKLQAQLAERDAKLEVKDPIEFLKQRGFTKEQVEDWLLNGGKSTVAQKSEIEQLKERLEKFERNDQERSTQTAAQQAEAQRAANEANYKSNVIGKAVDPAKYPLLHMAHAPADIVHMAYQRAVALYEQSGRKTEPDIHSVLGGMEKTLSELRDKLSPKQAQRASAPALTELASHSQAGTGGTEAEDDASAFAAATALAKQILATK